MANLAPLFLILSLVWGAAAAGEAGRELAPNTWVDLKPSGARPQLPSWETLCYAAAIKRAVVYGDYKMFSTECQHVLWGYDFEANRWDILDNSGYWGSDFLPGAGHDFSRLQVEQRLGVVPFPNITTTVYGRYATDYDLLARCGRALNGPGQVPWVTDFCGVLYDPARRVLVGPVEKDPGILAAWDPTARKSERLPPLPEEARKQAGYSRLLADPRTDRYYLLGNSGGLWAFDPKAKSWSAPNPGGEKPPANFSPQAVYNDRYGVILYFVRDGGGAKGEISSLFVYDPKANAWSKEECQGKVSSLTWDGKPGNECYYSSWTVYDSDHEVCLSAGGAGSAKSTYAFRYVPKDRNPLEPLPPFPASKRMEALKPAGAENWSAAEMLNLKPEQAAMGTALAAHDQGLLLAWGEDQAVAGLRDWDGTAWSKPSGFSGYFPALAAKPGGEAAVVSYQVAWSGFTLQFGSRPAGGAWSKPDASVTALMAAQANKEGAEYPGKGLKVASIKDPVACFFEHDLYVATPLSHNGWLVVWKRSADGNWAQAGEGPLTRNSVGRLSLAVAGKELFLAWDERNKSGEQVLVRKWNGKQWEPVGGPLNQDPAGKATKPCLYGAADGKLYGAFIERKMNGTVQGHDQVWVKRLSEGKWEGLGSGSLNVSGAKGNAWSPALAGSNGGVWVAWAEYRPERQFVKDGNGEIMLYDRPQVFVAHWDGQNWKREGTLNADPAEGSAGYVSLALCKGKPVVAWAEAKGVSGPRQVFARSRR